MSDKRAKEPVVLRVGRWLVEFDTTGLPVRMRPTKPEESDQ